MDQYITAKQEIAKLAGEARSGTLNEATTRLHVIDRILINCLDWRTEEIQCESHYNGDYVDYALGSNSVEVIVEAKKVGFHFNVPTGLTGRRSIDLRSLTEHAQTEKAIQQVLRYCQERGVPLAVLTNGNQLIAFYASRQDGVPPLQGRALLFSSLAEMEHDFNVLWGHLSREGVAAKNLQRYLLGQSPKAIPPPKLADQISNYPGFRQRTSLETDLKTLGDLFLQDLGTSGAIENDFVRGTYCPTGALSQYATVSKEILRSRYQSLRESTEVEPEPVTTRKGTNEKLTQAVISDALSKRPLLIVGDVGVGKSMFLRHLLQVEAREVLENAYVLLIDFGKEPALAEDLRSFVNSRIVEQLRHSYNLDVDEDTFVRSIYKTEVERFARTPWGRLKDIDPTQYLLKEVGRLEELASERDTHLRTAFEYLRKKKRRTPVIVLDNVDQRPGAFQDEVFLIAQALADRWPGTVFVSLRPSTLYESKAKGSLSAYQLRVFTVSPARVDHVILRRLRWAHDQLISSVHQGAFAIKFSANAASMRAYLDTLISAFSESKELNEIIDNLSGGNIRTALEFLATVVGSGYISAERLVDVAERGESYKLPIHEFMRAILFGDAEYFSPSASKICNVFDITSDDGREHFLLCSLLAHIERMGDAVGSRGYVNVADVNGFAQGLGYSQEQVGPHLVRALEKNLLDAPQGKGAAGPFRITTIGSYMYKSMVARFSYVDAVIVDTPVIDILKRKGIRDVHAIMDRLARAEHFIEYLDAQWAKLASHSHSPFRWDDASSRLRSEIEVIRARVERAIRRQRFPQWEGSTPARIVED